MEQTIGFALSLPWGLVVFFAIGVLILMIISEITWKKMEHLPEDDEPWDEECHFEMQDEEDIA